jgi:Ni,Fe-hydrogenase III large subunit/Ni,Fe-hydrogenase III component G
MAIRRFLKQDATRLSMTPPCWRAEVTRDVWSALVRDVRDGGGRMVSLWGSDRRPLGEQFAVHVAYALADGLLWVSLPLAAGMTDYPDLAASFPAAGRMQRALRDLLGLNATGAEDLRPWLRHGHWPANYHPLRYDADASAQVPDAGSEDYAFVTVSGDGVHEIPVGPVHAGIIEPGHFRFSVVGEKVLRLEQRLGYKHKGIDKRFESLAPLDAYRLAGRVSGDSTVAFCVAYCDALESACHVSLPPRAQWLRTMALERERVANHLGDLGALGNDAALAFGLAQFSRLKEDWLRLSQALLGHRFMMDYVVPGGVAREPDSGVLATLRNHHQKLREELARLRRIYDSHAGLQDRFITTGRVSPHLAAELGLTGFAARASGQAFDLRAMHPAPPYAALGVKVQTQRNGDVAARVAVRFDELLESLRLLDGMVAHLPAGDSLIALAAPTGSGFGCGWVEGWRGEVMVALELDAQGAIRRCHCHDPSWHNWPLLEHAVMGNIVPDFPLINKSFNLSYAGPDL